MPTYKQTIRAARDARLPRMRLARFIRLLNIALKVRRQRRALATLDDRMLKDIGQSRSTAYREVSRRLFDLSDEPAEPAATTPSSCPSTSEIKHE